MEDGEDANEAGVDNGGDSKELHMEEVSTPFVWMVKFIGFFFVFGIDGSFEDAAVVSSEAVALVDQEEQDSIVWVSEI